MSFSLSPAVIVQEIDASLVVSNQSSTLGAFAGRFQWGSVNEPYLIADENGLIKRFGFPSSDDTAVDFFTIKSFFDYTSGAWVTRVGNKSMKNAVTNLTTDDATAITILNANEYNSLKKTAMNGIAYSARYAGTLGNEISVSVAPSVESFRLDLKSKETVFTIDFATTATKRSRQLSYNYVESDADAKEILKYINEKDILVVNTTRYIIVEIDTENKKITLDRVYTGDKSPVSVVRLWRFADEFSAPPVENTFHLVVFTTSSKKFPTDGIILETFEFLSTNDKSEMYYKTQIERKSEYLYAGGIIPEASLQCAVTRQLHGGNDGTNIGVDEYINAYEFYLNAETYNTPLLISGNAVTDLTQTGIILADYLVHTVAQTRKDTVAFISPALEAVLDNRGKEAQTIVENINRLQSSSYAFVDSGWVYVYDRYNDRQIAIPLNGHIAGLCALTDYNRDAWVSPAGTVRGTLRNVVKLVYNPSKIERDLLYSNSINPVVTLPNATSALYGDKTLLRLNTALSRLNVRRLLIVLEKNIATASAQLLFEVNDDFTQRRFVSMVEPLLKDAKGRRGLADYRIIADSSVNTSHVVENNGFVGQIYIKPLYSINAVKLQFVVVNASASFDEVTGQF